MVNSCRDDISFGLCCAQARCNPLLTVSGCGSRAFTSYWAVDVESVKICLSFGCISLLFHNLATFSISIAVLSEG